MKILIIGAMGRTGKLLTEYSLELGHSVTAFSRSVDCAELEDENLRYEKGDVLDAKRLAAVIPGHDIVICTFGVRTFSGPISLLSRGMANVVRVMSKHKIKRLLTLGGTGILQESKAQLRKDNIGFPPHLQNITYDHYRVFRYLKVTDLDWTIVTPPFMEDGERTKGYVVRADYFPEKAQSEIFVQDVADFVVKEMTENKFIDKRVGIAYPL